MASRPRLQVAFAPPQRFLHAVNRSRIGARDDEQRISCGDRRANFRCHALRGDDRLPGEVAAALGRDLVFHEDGLYAKALVGAHGVGDVLGIPVAVVGIDHHRQGRGRADIAGHGADVGKTHQTDVRHRMPRADRRKSADEHSPESGLLDQPCAEPVMCSGQHERFLAPRKFAKGRCSGLHCSFLELGIGSDPADDRGIARVPGNAGCVAAVAGRFIGPGIAVMFDSCWVGRSSGCMVSRTFRPSALS